MGLAWKISDILDMPNGVTQDTKDKAIREMIEFYQKHERQFDVLKCPMLDKALEGKLVIKDEYKRLGAREFMMQQGYFSMCNGNFDLDKQVEILSDTIERLYKTRGE